MYYMDGGNKRDRRIIFSKEIGLAIEEPPNGMTLADLWNPLWRVDIFFQRPLLLPIFQPILHECDDNSHK